MSEVATRLGICSYEVDTNVDFPPIIQWNLERHLAMSQRTSLLTQPLYHAHFKRNEQEILAAAKDLEGSVLIFQTDEFDVPLKKLAKQFDKVIIAAINDAAAQRAVEKIDRMDRHKVSVCVTDYTGLIELFGQKILQIRRELNQTNFSYLIDQVLRTIGTQIPHMINPENAGFDFIVSSNTLSAVRFAFEELFSELYLLVFNLPGVPIFSLERFENEHLDFLSRLVKSEGRIFASFAFSRQCIQFFNTPITTKTNVLSPSTLMQISHLFNHHHATDWNWSVHKGDHFDEVRMVAYTLTKKI